MNINLDYIIEYISNLLPVELFAMVGGFLEEMIAPIPSPLVMTMAGTLAEAQKYSWVPGLLIIAVLGSLGKTVGAWIYYVFTDKFEDVVMNKFGKFIGVSHKEIEEIGAKLNKGWKDNVFIFFSRALPIIPSAPVSITCGLVKLNIKGYVLSTFFGNIVRNIIFLYIGYSGLSSYHDITNGIESAESVMKIVFLTGMVGVVGFIYYKRHKNSK